MSETMVERVAKAIQRTFDEFADPTPSQQARAAIEAMREPTSEMVRFGESAGWQDAGHGLSQAQGNLSQVEGRKFAAASYRAMIDAALT